VNVRNALAAVNDVIAWRAEHHLSDAAMAIAKLEPPVFQLPPGSNCFDPFFLSRGWIDRA
jgi:hypothetical protein